jgi:hypothetical protein
LLAGYDRHGSWPSLGRLFAIEIARRGGRVVVNDLGGTMHGEGADSNVTDQVVEEISAPAVWRWHRTTRGQPGGGEAIVRRRSTASVSMQS